MPEIKNTFLKSKMNKDLDSRIIPNGEYRDGQNISVSTSEGADVGALENIRGNVDISSFGLDNKDLEIIGYYSDTANNRIFLFITNNNEGISNDVARVVSDGSFNDGNFTFTKNPVLNYIAYVSFNKNSQVSDSKILLSGSFLNFSKNNPIINISIIENLMFWTDNRNQPRKINIDRAIGDSFVDENNKGYYYNEDHISVAKYAPYSSINFLKYLDKQDPLYAEKTLKNEVDEFLPPFIAVPASVLVNEDSGRYFFNVNSQDKENKSSLDGVNNSFFTDLTNFLSESQGTNNGNSFFFFNQNTGQLHTNQYKVKVSIYGENGLQDAFLESVTEFGSFRLQSANGTPILNFENQLDWNLTDGSVANIAFSLRNPDYNENFDNVGDEDLLKEKFVRFSYRFKYDDDEYSLSAPFSQHAFTPKQFGYFIGDDLNNTKESSNVDFMVNQITSAGLVMDLPCRVNEMFDKLKVKELQILYKASDEQALKVITDIDFSKPSLIKGAPDEIEIDTSRTPSNQGGYVLNKIYKTTYGGDGEGLTVKVTGVDLSGGGSTGPVTSVEIAYSGYGYKIGESLFVGNGDGVTNDIYVKVTKLSSTYIHDYKSQKPIKVLPEKEIVRVSDIVPIKAKTQESVGNRVIYGNFQQTTESPNSLKYKVSFQSKSFLSTSENITDLTGVEFNNHTLKQGRSYQAGIVLQDRYGRSSNVILANDAEGFNSTFFAPYSNGGADPTSWLGNSITIEFDEKIPTDKNGDYVGLWSEQNPLGWYSYKVVVKQQEQDYYNIYTPGAVSGNIKFTKWTEPLSFLRTKSLASIALFNDNINKIPRDLKDVGPSDNIYSSSVELINRVNQTNFNIDENSKKYPDLNGQALAPYENSNITSIRQFRELGDWTIYKNVNLKYTTIGPAAQRADGSAYDNDYYIYPGNVGEVDPFFLENNKNPIITTISTNKRIGFSEEDQKTNNFAKELTIFETKPTKSSLDIYYETSTSGTIEDLNFNIEFTQSSINIASGISPIDIPLLQETEKFGEIISNEFQIVDDFGNIVNDNSCRITLDSVEYKSDSSSSFSVMQNVNSSSGSVPNYLRQKGFLSGNFDNSDTSNPFSLQENIISPQLPPVYKIISKRPLNRFDAGIEFKLNFKLTQNGIQKGDVEKRINLSDVRPFIGSIGIPNKSATDWTNRYNTLTSEGDGDQLESIRNFLKDWSEWTSTTNQYIKLARFWNHVEIVDNPNYNDPGNLNNFLVWDLKDTSDISKGFKGPKITLQAFNSYTTSDWSITTTGSNHINIRRVSHCDNNIGLPGCYNTFNGIRIFQKITVPGYYSIARSKYYTAANRGSRIDYYPIAKQNGGNENGRVNVLGEITFSSNGLEKFNKNTNLFPQYGQGPNIPHTFGASKPIISTIDHDPDFVIRDNANDQNSMYQEPLKNTRLANEYNTNNFKRRLNKTLNSTQESNNLNYRIDKGYVQITTDHMAGSSASMRYYMNQVSNPFLISKDPNNSTIIKLTPNSPAIDTGLIIGDTVNIIIDQVANGVNETYIRTNSPLIYVQLGNDFIEFQKQASYALVVTLYIVAEQTLSGETPKISNPYIIKSVLT